MLYTFTMEQQDIVEFNSPLFTSPFEFDIAARIILKVFDFINKDLGFLNDTLLLSK